jgi:LuxR family transcriptional regulator, maltose regulon positive regulatory protein
VSTKEPKLAKLTRPKLHNVLARNRLFALLDAGRERALTWVVGPPGAGKTALVASYIEAKKLKGVWYHLDRGDHDLSTFFHYLSQTVSIAPSAPPLPVITPEHLSDVPAFTRYYFSRFFAQLKFPAVLVFDNYHEIALDSALHAVLEQAAHELPDGGHMVAISREEPPAEFARLDALDRLSRIEWNDLKLTLDEATAIARLRFELDAATLRSLYDISKGWAAGLTLALERMKRSDTDVKQIQGEALESVFNYFAGQIFKSAEPNVREFLMRTALFQRLNAAMAARLSSNADAANLLDYFYRRRLFTDRRGEAPYSYQYHDLFRAFLLDQLSRTPVAELNALRLRAGEILEDEGRFDEAFLLYASAAEWNNVVRLSLSHAQTLLDQGRSETLRAWIRALPESVHATHAWINYWHGIAQMTSGPHEAIKLFERAYWLVEEPDSAAKLACCSAMITAHLTDLTDLRPVGPWVERLIALVRSGIQFPSPVVELQTYAALTWYAHLCAPRADYYSEAAERSLELIVSDIPVNDKIACACLMMTSLRETGRLRDVERINVAIDIDRHEKQLSPANIARWWLIMGYVEASRGRPTHALQALRRSEKTSLEHGITAPAAHVFVHQLSGAMQFQLYDLEAATAHAEKMELLLTRNDRLLEWGWACWVRSIVAAMRDDWATAVEFAERELAYLTRGGAVFHQYYAYLHLAGGLIGARDYAQAHQAIESARAILVDSFEYRNIADVDLMAAWLALEQGNMDRFDAHVRDAFGLLKRIEPHACLWYVDQRILPRVLAQALWRGIERDHVCRLIRHLALRPPADADEQWPWPIKIFVLGRFDLLLGDARMESNRRENCWHCSRQSFAPAANRWLNRSCSISCGRIAKPTRPANRSI